MTTLRRRLALIAAALSAVALLAGPAQAGGVGSVATESVEEGDSGEREKIQLPEDSHHRVGLIILGASGVLGLLVADNIRRRLKGEGEKATGEFRWR
ncbi:MAG TPA: hypothetical protein VGA36_05685 [Nitriliruptorales bacterium]|jgi:hypothetical protein